MPDENLRHQVPLNFYDHLGILYAKSFLKIIGILFVLMELAWGKFPNLFVSLIFLFIIYFTMPTSFRKDEPYKASEAWFRMLVGFMIAFTLFSFLSPGVNAYDPALWSSVIAIIAIALVVGVASYSFPSKWIVILVSLLGIVLTTAGISLIFPGKVLPDALPIFFITFAFLATAPKAEKEEGAEEIKIMIPGQKMRDTIDGDSMENFGSGFFLTLMFAGGWPIVSWVKGGLQLILGAVWIISGFVGFMSGREGRPYIGIIMIGFAVLAYSFQFTGTVGTAVFGAYWTPIYNFGTEAFGPIGKSLDTASRQVNFAMCTITAGPGVCDALINPPAESAGSTDALTFTNFEAINYRSGNPEINPQIPLIGTIQLDNRGDFVARNVSVVLKDPITFDPKQASINDPSKALKLLDPDTCVFDSCLDGTMTGNKCAWPSSISKGDIKILSFKCGSSVSIDSGWTSLNKCACIDPRTGNKMSTEDQPCDVDCGSMKSEDSGTFPKSCRCTNEKFSSYCQPKANVLDSYCKIEDSLCKNEKGDFDCSLPGCSSVCNGQVGRAIRKYADAGWNLRIGFDYLFDYSTNVSLPVRVMDKQTFLDKLRNRQIVLEDVNPVYSGGPVSVGIWVGKQPIRTDDSTIGTIYIQNNGEGIVKSGAVLRLVLPTGGLSFANTEDRPKVVSTSFSFKGSPRSSAINGASCSFIDGANEYVGKYLFSCPLARDLDTGEAGTITFSFRYSMSGATEKNTIFVGGLDYTYNNTKSFAFPVVAVPSQ